MRQNIDVPVLCADALRQLRRVTYDDRQPRTFPMACPYTLEQRLTVEPEALEEALFGPDVG